MILKPRISLWALSLFALGLATCRQVAGVDDLSFQDAGSTGSTTGADGGEVDAKPSACQSTTYPPPPLDMGADEGNIDFTGAIRSINLGEGGDKESPVGLNLDAICTCLDEGTSCSYPSYAIADHCDDTGGVDNAASRLFASMAAAIGPKKFGSEFYSNKANEGTWTLLLRVSGYNGMPDDPQVKLAIYRPAGLESSSMDTDKDAGNDAGGSPCVSGGDGGLAEQQPCWNGNDVWKVDEGSVGGPGGTIDTPVYVDANAYVAGGILVGNFSGVPLSLSSGTGYMEISLTAGLLVASLQNPQSQSDNLGWRIASGTIAGRWRTVDIFDSLSTFTAEGNSLCTDDTITYPLFKKRICEYVDISSKLGGPTLECDSISFGMTLSTLPVKLGAVTPTATPMKQCMQANDPALDSCDKQ